MQTEISIFRLDPDAPSRIDKFIVSIGSSEINYNQPANSNLNIELADRITQQS